MNLIRFFKLWFSIGLILERKIKWQKFVTFCHFLLIFTSNKFSFLSKAWRHQTFGRCRGQGSGLTRWKIPEFGEWPGKHFHLFFVIRFFHYLSMRQLKLVSLNRYLILFVEMRIINQQKNYQFFGSQIRSGWEPLAWTP